MNKKLNQMNNHTYTPNKVVTIACIIAIGFTNLIMAQKMKATLFHHPHRCLVVGMGKGNNFMQIQRPKGIGQPGYGHFRSQAVAPMGFDHPIAKLDFLGRRQIE